MGLLADLRTLRHLIWGAVEGESHAARLESFYRPQAGNYDRFRQRMLQGRRELFEAIAIPPHGVWLDLGGGTGHNLQYLGRRLHSLRKVYVVDLCPPLLDVARQRIREHGWTNVEAVHGDATSFAPPEQPVDAATFSYSLTMMEDWFAALDHAASLLAAAGVIGVVDFYVSRKHPQAGLTRHAWWARTLWPAWFAADNVFLSPDHLPFLRRRFETLRLEERTARLPWLPLVRAPYYLFVGRRRDRWP